MTRIDRALERLEYFAARLPDLAAYAVVIVFGVVLGHIVAAWFAG